MDMVMSDDVLSKLKAMLLQQYDAISLDEMDIPEPMKRDMKLLKDKVRTHIANVDVEAMKTNTSLQIITMFDGELIQRRKFILS